VVATLQYVSANRENVQLFREQLKHQRTAYLDFGIKNENFQLWLWVANLGLANFIVNRVLIPGHHTDTDGNTDVLAELLVPSGKVERLLIPTEVYDGESLHLDINISLRYTGLEETKLSASKAFCLYLDSNRILAIKEGLHTAWAVSCPKCSNWGGFAWKLMA
jgi:hypothetical protein